VVKKYGIKYFYDITDRSDFRANPDYKGVCHVALAQEGHCKPGGCMLFLPPQLQQLYEPPHMSQWSLMTVGLDMCLVLLS